MRHGGKGYNYTAVPRCKSGDRHSICQPLCVLSIKTPFYGQKRTSQIRLPVRNFAVFTDGIHQIRLSVRNFAVFTDGAVQEGAHSEISKVYRKKLLDEYIKRHY